MTIRMNPAFEAELRRSREMEMALEEAAHAVESNVQSLGIRVEGVPGDVALPVEVFDGDEGEAIVAITHPSGGAVQAKHGALTKAAAQAGLSLQSRG